MRKIVGLCAFSAMVAVAAPSMAQEQKPGWYGQANIGAGVGGAVQLRVTDSILGHAQGEDDTKVGPFVSLAAGRSFEGGFAIEAEALYLQNKVDTPDINDFLGFPLDAKAKTYALMVNGMFAIAKTDYGVPYIGAGVGWGKTDYKAGGETIADNGMVWQVRAGISIPRSETVSWDIGYRYLEAPDAKKTYGFVNGSNQQEVITLEGKTKQHILSAGWRWRY